MSTNTFYSNKLHICIVRVYDENYIETPLNYFFINFQVEPKKTAEVTVMEDSDDDDEEVHLDD